jgi:small subunit ribosomal protein S21
MVGGIRRYHTYTGISWAVSSSGRFLEGRCFLMIKVTASPEENVESLIRKFNKKVLADGLLSELKKREYYVKPSIAKKQDEAARRRKLSKHRD